MTTTEKIEELTKKVEEATEEMIVFRARMHEWKRKAWQEEKFRVECLDAAHLEGARAMRDRIASYVRSRRQHGEALDYCDVLAERIAAMPLEEPE